ncbi:MAG: RDD family protein [Chitinophagales bacterium]|nr:RDD family protein [Chitinophagales bacterium]
MEYSRFQNANAVLLDSISGLCILISMIVVAFDRKKQALHDKIANTYCIKEN